MSLNPIKKSSTECNNNYKSADNNLKGCDKMSSYWIDSYKNQKIDNQIDNNYESDVCIVGAGMCGLSTGYYLAQKGLKVIIVDKDNIGQKTSGNTTAKITFQHNLIYDYLINSFGIEFALGYLNSNMEAIPNIKNIIDTENIDCDFEYQDNYVYTTKQEELTKIHNEVKALNILSGSLISYNQEKGNSFAQFVTNCELPFKICGAIKVKNQAHFHPLKYMFGLTNAIQNYGGLVFTNSLVSDIQRNDEYYTTYVNQYSIKSKYVVIASHYPFINFLGFYFSKMYQSTSYVLGVDTKKHLFDGMYINPVEPTFSYRTAKYGDRRILIITGGDHKTGYAPDNSSTGYEILEKEIFKHYPNSEILYKWNTRDCITLDKVPYIGNFSNFMPNMYVATGFNKWGMTNSNIAANIIKDKILGIENKYSFVYDSTRFSPIKNRGEIKNMASQVIKSFITNRIKIPEEDLSTIKNDNGGIIRVNGSAVGIYKDINGKIYAVDPTCTHLGCLLTWNNLDKTWDCPCHGSRFDYTGKNIYDPAFKNLDIYDV